MGEDGVVTGTRKHWLLLKAERVGWGKPMELFTREKSPRRLVGMALEWDGRIWILGLGVTLFNLYIRLGYSGMPHPGKPGSFEFQEEGFRTPTS